MKKLLLTVVFIFLSVGNCFATSTGAKACATVETAGSWGYVAPTPTKLASADSNRAEQISVAYPSFGTPFQASDFTFGIPSGATIDGIGVYIEGSTSYDSPRYAVVKVGLSWDDGSTWTADSATWNMVGYYNSGHTFGGTTNTWGRTWADTDFANGSFRVRVYAAGDNVFMSSKVDRLAVTVYYTEAAPPTLTLGSIINNAVINNAVIQ